MSVKHTEETTKKKSYWGYGVIIVYSIFALGTLSVVYFSYTQEVDLVAKDYYSKSLVHDKQMEITSNGLTQKVTVSINNDKSVISIYFPYNDVRGSVQLYRPSGSALDKEFPFQQCVNNTFTIPTAGLAKGYWRIKVKWNHSSMDYFNEYKIEL